MVCWLRELASVKMALARETSLRRHAEDEAEVLSNAYIRWTDWEADLAAGKDELLRREAQYKAKLAAAEVRRTYHARGIPRTLPNMQSCTVHTRTLPSAMMLACSPTAESRMHLQQLETLRVCTVCPVGVIVDPDACCQR